VSTVLLFSVIVPLEDHRDHWERCLRAWQAQTLPKSSFETIFVTPPDFPADARQKLKGLLGPQDRLEYFDANHDIDLLAAGAARALGRYLFFTESHCWPKPDVLDRCLKTFAAHPDWAGFSGRSTRITHNRLSEVEADMYEGDFEHSLSATAWRMVLDQCFATRRDRYEECGGFKPEYGHYAEWLLAANYVAHGQKLGFEPAALVYHRYTGRISYVRKFTLDFSAGEIRYFARHANEHANRPLEAPPEWQCKGRWDRRLARSIVGVAARDMIGPGDFRRRRASALAILRWLVPAAFGGRAAQLQAGLQRMLTLLVLRAAVLAGSRAQLSAAFQAYIAALIRSQRLAGILASSDAGSKDHSPDWNPFSPNNAGFHLIEESEAGRFRWSEPAAIMQGWAPAGQSRIRIECTPFRRLTEQTYLQFYLNERAVAKEDVTVGPSSVDIRIHLLRAGPASLAWICRRFRAPSDTRRLGIPVMRIELRPATELDRRKRAPETVSA
jgi:hypothetical protein